jgi:hypothetical protein
VITGDILGERARLSPDAVALIHVPTRLQFTYAELNRRALQCARVWTDLCSLAREIASASFPRTGLNMSMPFGQRVSPASSSSLSGRAARLTNCTRYSRTADRAASCTPPGTETRARAQQLVAFEHSIQSGCEGQ